ncbi:MAG TPA: hypothetical protein VF142_12130 [Longimicrobium sp.]
MSSTEPAALDPALAEPATARDLLRHAVATLAYRGGKALRGAPDRFSDFSLVDGSCTHPLPAAARAGGAPRDGAGDLHLQPLKILAHVGDLLVWALWMAKGEHRWRDDEPGTWERQVEPFYGGWAAMDENLASGAPLGGSAERLFQGPIADAPAHVGQPTMLRRLAGAPARGEIDAKAHLAAGRVGPEQAPSGVELE